MLRPARRGVAEDVESEVIEPALWVQAGTAAANRAVRESAGPFIVPMFGRGRRETVAIFGFRV